MQRRSFLASLGAGAFVALIGSAAGCNASGSSPAASSRRRELGPLGIQLYTLRAEMERDFDATLERLGRIGYREVEFAGYFGRSAAQVRAILEGAGLSAPSTHVSLDSLEGTWDQTVEFARAIGCSHIVVPWLSPERRRSLDDYRRLAQQFNDFGARLQRAGFTFAYHNHDFEFERIDGGIPFDILLQETDPASVKIQLDCYWATKAGRDPLDFFARYPGRFPSIHIKDSGGPADHPQVNVGSGTIDWRRILAARDKAGIRHLFVEHDDPSDPWAFAETSYRYLQSLEI